MLNRHGVEDRFRLILALLVFAAAISVAATGCGATARQHHERLNWVTRAADPTYEMVLEACDESRNFVVSRQGTTRAQDEAAWDEIEDVCDRAVASFELLAHTQHSAREAVDEGVPGVTRELIQRALSIWAELQELAGDLLDDGVLGGGQ